MYPHIDGSQFGSITVAGQVYEHDIVIGLDGCVRKRQKKLSKAIYGTSHIISLDEARQVYEQGAERLIVGAGQYGLVKLSDEAASFFAAQGCRVDLLAVPQAIEAWNGAQGTVIGLFHVTC